MRDSMTSDAAPSDSPSPLPKRRRPRAVLRPALLSAAFALSVVALMVLFLRAWVWPQLDRWREPIQALASKTLGRSVQIGQITGAWSGLAPVFLVRDLQIGAPDGRAGLSVASVRAVVSPAALWTGALRFSSLVIESPRVQLTRDQQGGVALAGWAIGRGPQGSSAQLDWLLSQGLIQVQSGQIELHDAQGRWPQGDQVPLALRFVGGLDGRELDLQLGQADRKDAGSVLLRARWQQPLWSRPGALTSWTGVAYLEGQGIAWSELMRHTVRQPSLAPGSTGDPSARVGLQVWAGFERGRDLRVFARTEVTRAELRRPDPARVSLVASAVVAPASRQSEASIWAGRIASLTLADLEGLNLKAAGSLSLPLMPDRAQTPPRPFEASLEFEPLELQSVGGFLSRLRRVTGLNLWPEDLQLKGRLDELRLKADPSRTGGEPWLEARVSQAGLAFQAFQATKTSPPGAGPSGPSAGITGFSGEVRWRPGDAQVQIDAGPLEITLPGVWAEPTLRLTRLNGALTAHRNEGSGSPNARRWTIETPGMAYATEDFSGTARVKWAAVPGSPGQLQLNASIDRVAANRVVRYLPSVVGPVTRAWLQQSIRSGTIEKIEMQVQGDLARFPFREPASGLFRISGSMRDVGLDYAPGWPGLEGLEGQLIFERAGFEVASASARIQGVTLRTLKARMADFREGMLSVEGQGDGPAQAMLDFIDRSPLASSISTFTRDLSVKSAAEMGLALQIPVFDPSTTRVRGHVLLSGNDLILDSTLPPFEGVQGRIEFTESGLALKDVRAQFLGGPLSVNATHGAAGQLRIDAQGRLQVSAVRSLLDNALTRSLSGSVPYRAEIDVDRRASSLRLRSDLTGLASSLPAPLSKSAGQRLSLEVRSQPLAAARPNERPPGDRVDVMLGPDMHLALERRRDPASDRLRVQRAGFGMGSAPVLRDRGLSVSMRTEFFDFDAWRAVLARTDLDTLSRGSGEQTLPGFTLVPDWVSVVADSIRIGGQTLNAVVIGASRQESHWRANIAAQEISGHFEWLDARPGEPIGTLRARFDRLSLSRARESEVEAALARAPDLLPALEISVESLALGRVELGRLLVSAANTGSAQQPVWTLQRLEIENPHARLSATGRWAFFATAPGAARAREVAAATGAADSIDPRSTELDLALQVRDAGGLLARFGIEHAVRAAPGELSGSLHWHGSPLALDLPSLQGALQLSLGHGNFLRIDPGAARLIAVLNLQALARLLTGDLLDVFREGFAFDSIKGQVAIQDGVIKTSDLTMRGPQATVTLQGSADLKQETQSLQVRVVPEFNANLASVAVGAMVNPAVGLGSLAAQYVLRKPLQQALAVEFDIDGSWTEPRIRERRASSDNPSRTP